VVLLLRAGSHIPEFSIVLFGLYKILTIMVGAMAQVGRTNEKSIFKAYWDQIEKRALQIIKFLTIFYWFYSLSASFEVSRILYYGFIDFFIKERSIGTMDMTIGGIFSLILILAGTFLLTGLIKILIEELLLKRSKLPRGVPAAISVTIRYFLIVLGFTFALSAAGIELGKFSLLAGALGVGIGFGLQNIVNNFISGIILVYERPLQVGDTIEVENLLGRVNHIGIRSSHVKTYDGAEVVVPNGNLISNQLINWTLSDNQRRIEIKVGTSYGSDPNFVLKLLEEVANDNPDTLKEPPPRALFESFGDSSLNFRLLFWVPYDMGFGTKSDVAVGIFNKFKEHNIQIPFPQVDVNMKGQINDKINENEA
jgi:small-conductance mechanosensitive channel